MSAPDERSNLHMQPTARGLGRAAADAVRWASWFEAPEIYLVRASEPALPSTKETVMSAPNQESEHGTKVERLKDLLHCQDKAVVSRMLVKNSNGSVTLFAFDRGEGLSEHAAPYDALLVGVEGEAEVRIGATTHLLGEGQAVLIPATVPHAVNPITTFKMLLVMIRGERST